MPVHKVSTFLSEISTFFKKNNAEGVLSENRYRVSKWSLWSKSFWSFSFRGMRFQCHYINIINYIYIVSRKESVKSFLTLMTNDQMTASRYARSEK